MSYLNASDVSEPIRRVLLGALDLNGRAIRTDGVIYYFLATLLTVVISFAMSVANLSVPAQMDGIDVFLTILQLPLIAWFVRRLHDQGRSGWFALIFPVAWGLNWLELSSPYDAIVMLPLVIALFAFIFWPPTPGPNRYGPNPRSLASET